MIVLLWALGNFERVGVERELGGRWEGGEQTTKLDMQSIPLLRLQLVRSSPIKTICMKTSLMI